VALFVQREFAKNTSFTSSPLALAAHYTSVHSIADHCRNRSSLLKSLSPLVTNLPCSRLWHGL